MALTKEEVFSYYTDTEANYHFITEIKDTIIKDNGTEISSSRHREVVVPGYLDSDGTYQRTTLTGYSQGLQDIAAALWDDDLHTSYENSLS